MKKMLFIVNPRSGMLKVNRLLPEIIGLFNENGYEVTIYITAGPQDATNIVLQRAKDHDLVVCAGGDGTLNETISGVLQSGLDLPIGYIPAGSTNDFAASLNLPLNVLDAARLIVEGEPAALDVGQFEDRYFSYVASFGAFTKAAYSTNQSIKNALGHLAYVLEGIQEIPQIRKNHVRIEADGIEIEDDFIFGAISNSTSVGGILKVSPDRVDMADGKFEIFLVRLPRDPMELSEIDELPEIDEIIYC